MQAGPELEQRIIPRRMAQAVRETACDIASWARSPFDPRLPTEIDTYARELPTGLAELLAAPGDAGAAVLDGLTVDDTALGPTPPSWRHAGRALDWDITMMLLGRCAGVPFGWQGQQNGRLVNDVVPTEGHEDEQTGASSMALLTPHTEDAFHPGRADLLLLGCLRNPDRVATTLSSVRYVRLDDVQRRLLAAPTLPILPDVSYDAVATNTSGPLVRTVWPGEDGLMLRYDPAYTPLPRASAEFRSAYSHLTEELRRVRVGAALAPGQLLLIDNNIAVHGRVPFTARYDGADRWLKRINVRTGAASRDPAESAEDGYGQRLVEPFAEPVSVR